MEPVPLSYSFTFKKVGNELQECGKEAASWQRQVGTAPPPPRPSLNPVFQASSSYRSHGSWCREERRQEEGKEQGAARETSKEQSSAVLQVVTLSEARRAGKFRTRNGHSQIQVEEGWAHRLYPSMAKNQVPSKPSIL